MQFLRMSTVCWR